MLENVMNKGVSAEPPPLPLGVTGRLLSAEAPPPANPVEESRVTSLVDGGPLLSPASQILQPTGDVEQDRDRDWFAGAPLGQLVFDRTYSRPTQDGRKEIWPETVTRTVDGNLALVSEAYIEPGERERLLYLIASRIALPGGRHLWSSGTTAMALQNCFRSGFSKGYQAHAAFVFNQLMLGGGVGANYSTSYFATMPRFMSRVVPRFVCDEEHVDIAKMRKLNLFETQLDDPQATTTIQIADSREGWVHALEQLIWHTTNSVSVTILFDVSLVRPEGSPILGFGGTAAGPMPLMLMLQQVADLLTAQRGQRPTPLFAMAVDHAIASCVVAGNVRRSARMSILHWNDSYIFDFINCKQDSQLHWSTNISVEVDDAFFAALNENDSHANAVLEQVSIGMLLNGEPGFYNSALASQGETGDVRATNPCGEITLENFESCILGHVNLAFGTEWERQEAFRLMARFLVRTTCAPMNDPKTKEIVSRNRRIGVGFLGLQEWMATEGLSYAHPTLETEFAFINSLKNWKDVVRDAADEYCDQMQIPRCIKVTTVAPTGTIAKLAGTTEGIQPLYSKYYIRNINYSDTDHQLPMLKDKYDHEMSVYTANTTVVSIPTKDSVLNRLNGTAHHIVDAGELSADHALRLQALVQEHFADNAISLTVNVQPDHYSVAELKQTIQKWLPQVKGMTVFPELSRPQSPLIRITQEDYERHLNREVAQPDIDQCQGSCPIR